MAEKSIKNMSDEEVEDEFDKVVEDLSDGQWWAWVRSWFDVLLIQDIYNEWDTELKRDALEDISAILENKKGGD